MTADLIPQDPLTRRQLAKVLAKMIRDDFEKARSGGASLATGPTAPRSDDDFKNRRQVHCTPGAVEAQLEG